MDNKKWYKRFTTMFWCILACMPMIISFFQLIGSFLVHTDSLNYSDLNSYVSSIDFKTILSQNVSSFADFTPSVLKDLFADVFHIFDNTLQTADISIIGNFLAWFSWVFFIIILVDVVVWLPKLFHCWLERWV